ncbi:hypothetical protein, conserved [Leishmania tarentolae]|uniref:Uncharacterized protein n=1 Tax=Leishmania tarentolae TaxID=5689 RepID=A0A640KEU9_LEITA|nr:hypothetical protein, conserved [Leishmania tarentolae]
MSRHFSERKDAERSTGLLYLLSPSRVPSPGEQRFRWHGHVRCALVIGMGIYFVYCNPEYSYAYTALRQRCGWNTTEPMFPQYLKLQSTQMAGSSTASEQTHSPPESSSLRSSAVNPDENVWKKGD